MTEQPPPDETQPMGSGQPAAASAGDPLVEWAIPETRPVPGRRQIVYADIPNRVIAFFVDLVAVAIIAVAVGVIFALAFTAGGGLAGRVESGVSFLVNLIVGAITVAYFVYGWTT